MYVDLVPRDLVPPYLRVANALRDMIMEGELLPGEQIPSLDDLAARHGVARVTARKAVKLLVDEGLLETRPRWGTFVSERQ